MDQRVMEFRLKQWIPVFEEQARSGLNKDEWCIINGISRGSFFRWQKRVRAYLLEHGENENPLPAQEVVEHTENEGTFVELSCSQAALPGIAALRNLHDDICDDPSSIRINYGGFLINVGGLVDEKQLTTVLRAMKNVE